MSKKTVKYSIATVIILFLAYHSVYIKKLDEVKAATTGNFDAEAYTKNLWEKELIPSLHKAVPLDTLLVQLEKQPQEAFKKHSQALGIGNVRYFLVQGQAAIISKEDNAILLQLEGVNSRPFQIATEFIYGNQVRDASGLIPMTAFKNTMDFNNVSAAINKKIRKEVIPQLKKNSEKGQKIKFFGAIELNQKYLDINQIEIIPVKIELI